MLRLNGLDVPMEQATRVIFTDQRINILSTLYIVNAFVFLISLPLQITIAVVDVRQYVQALALAPITGLVFHVISVLTQFYAERNNNPTLVIASVVLAFACCFWAVTGLIAFETVIVLSSNVACTTDTCSSVCACSVIVSFVTIAGLVINAIGFNILYPLVFRNPNLTGGNTTQPVAVPTPAEVIAFPPGPAENPDDDVRGIESAMSIVNEGFAYSRAEDQVETNPSSNNNVSEA